MTKKNFKEIKNYDFKKITNEISKDYLYHGLNHTKDNVLPAIERLVKYENINDKNRLKAYLFRTAYNMALNYKRDNAKHKNRLESDFDNMTPNVPDTPDIILESTERRERINAAIEKLAEKQKEAVLHRFYNEMKISEIARIMKISEGTVKVHLVRGLQNLKKHLYNTIGKERL